MTDRALLTALSFGTASNVDSDQLVASLWNQATRHLIHDAAVAPANPSSPMLAEPTRFSASSTRLNSTVLPGAVSYALTIRGPLHVDAPNIAVCPLLPDEQSCSCSVSSTSTDPERLIGAAMVRSLVANKPLSQRQDALARIRHTPDAKPREPRGQPTSECDASALPSHSQRADGGDELVEVERLAVASVAAEFVGDLRRGRQRREHDDFRAG